MSIIFEPMVYQSPQVLFEFFAQTAGNILIDSANGGYEAYGTNRYSYILIDPFDFYTYHLSGENEDPFITLRQKLAPYQLQPRPELPPFQGGVVGYLSYDLVHLYHTSLPKQSCDNSYPEVAVGFYDLLCSFDHQQQRAYIISSGLPELFNPQRLNRAQKRLRWLKQKLEECAFTTSDQDSKKSKFYPSASPTTTTSQCLVPTTYSNIHITSNFTKPQYLEAVKKIINYIKSGDIFEANVAQRFEVLLPKSYPLYELYKKLCTVNPSPFAAFLNFGKYKIISASPERFIQLHHREVETRPIKGTRPRSKDPELDAAYAAELLSSEKDIAENIMIVDLMRNDLSLCCEDDSVVVEQLCCHEIYPTVHHLVSVISGRLREGEDALSLLKAAFPGGSVTGAPKIRALEIIAEIEPHRRGPYCGNMVLLGFDGNMDSSILIRTYVIQDHFLTFHAGGAVVLDSDPEEEYQETLSKSFALTKTLLS